MSTPNPATSPWVPLWNLNGGVNLNYRGAYVAATNYVDGDIVIQNGVAYMCVRPTVNPPASWPMAPGVTQYATSLPTSPYDGQEAVLVDNVVNPSYQWRFRYNAGSTSAYKWEFVGGAPIVIVLAGITTTAFTPWTADANGFTITRAGDYIVSITGRVYVAGASTMFQPGIRNRVGNEAIVGEHRATNSSVNDFRSGCAGTVNFACVIGDVATAILRNGSNDGVQGRLEFSSLSVLPRRVS